MGVISFETPKLRGPITYFLKASELVPPFGNNCETSRSDYGTFRKDGRFQSLPTTKEDNKKSTKNSTENVRKPSAETIEAFYQAYPRKVDPQAAKRAIEKALLTVPAEELLSAVERFAAATDKWPEEERKFIPYPANWFNDCRWEDDPKEWERSGKNIPRVSDVADLN